ncbi:hypothetical protein SAMN05421670_1039 [Psychrobacillus psychrotolerans]|uniref:Uncharacterized protein n=1 Tax=Psychrobacillus psychrotolerans TaxID=126156 RepID=A0A1I5W173_9BACI|nr:hypothetical protein SAMN05421670_1039 [Psychrobacillus psychrotolerans]
MKKANVILFLMIFIVGIVWGLIYWLFIAPNANL